MAIQARGRREKHEKDMGLCNCIIAVFQVMIACQSITFISGQGYLYSDTEFQSRKILQDVSLFPKQQAQGVTSEPHDKKLYPITPTTSQIKVIRFEPPFLDFDVECIGMPKLKTVYIHNPSKERDLQLSSISARTSHFHASFFDKKNVQPGGNTSFEVVFLARVVGNVENTLFINTVHGTFPYQVFGVGIPNPYRLRPYLGARVPVNSTFSPLISMHNPTGEPLQVTEMYSSSGFLQLQLPQGEQELDKDQWEIPPYETKQVIRARFLGQVEANHTAFIRIKTAQLDNSISDFHILPMEVEVSSDPGIYSSIELLDFGTLRTQYDDPKTLPLFLLNSGNHEVLINSITPTTPNPAIKIQFKPIKLKPLELIFTLVANITFSAILAKSQADQQGTITVKTKDKSYSTVVIPFVADLLDGTLGYDQDAVLFHHNELNTIRPISLSNLFHFPVVIQNITVAEKASKIFKVLNFKGPVTLPLSSPTSPFSIQYDPGDDGRNVKEEKSSVYFVSLYTNASKFSLPLYTYSGLISYKVLREDNKKLDFGIMSTLDKRQVLFALYNHNPAKILLEKINSTLRNIDIRLVSITQDSGKNLTEDSDFHPENFLLPSNSCSVFEVTLSASEKEEEIINSITILTKYQEIVIPVVARIVIGTLTVKPEKIKFPPSFPGFVVHKSLSIVNTFAQVTTLDSVHSKEIDKRFYYKKLKNQGFTLEPNKKAKIGKIYFDARQSCKPDRCYTGLPTSTTIGYHWLTTLALGPDSVEFDTKRYKEHRQRWKNLQSRGLTTPNTTLVLSADVVMNVEVPVQASLYWPTLLEKETFEFPLTHVGKKSVATLTVVNPADSPVVVQVLPLSLYPQPEAALAAFGWSDKVTDESFVINNSTVFHLMDPRQDMSKDSMTSQMVWLEYTLNGKLNHTVVNLFLDPGDRVDLKVEFVPYDDNPRSTVILLRNNLTILDALPTYGRGVYEHLTLGGKLPNSQSSTLRFKLTKELLKDCTKKKKNPSFTVRKWFHANNTGLLPIHITSMTVSGSPCEGYGFRVLDCDQFILQPNTSKKIEIAYTPDFTSYLVLHKLKLVTAQGNEMIFLLNVTLPPYMLPLCQEAVPRPNWEAALYYFIVIVMLVLFVGILLMAYLEAINIWEPFVQMYEVKLQHKLNKKKTQLSLAPEGFGKLFDLRHFAENFRNTVTQSQIISEPMQSVEPGNSISQKRKTSLISNSKSAGTLTDKKQDISLQTDPHPDFPPLSSSNFLLFSYPRRLLSRIFPCLAYASQSVKLPQTRSLTSVSFPKPLPTNDQQAARLRQNIAPCNQQRKNSTSKKFKQLPIANLGAVDKRIKPTAEIQPVVNSFFESSRKSSRSSTPDKINSTSLEQHEILKNALDNFKDLQIANDEAVTHDFAKKNAQEKRRLRSKSNSHMRGSSSSSGSADLPETKMMEEQAVVMTFDEEDVPLKSIETKPLRGKKLKKLTRKQAKALARERENLEKEAMKADEKMSTLSDEEEKLPVIEQKKVVRKPGRLLKSRTASSNDLTNVNDNILPEVLPAKKSLPDQRKSFDVIPGLSQNQSVTKDEVKFTPKRRSHSYNSYTDNKPKYTIYKRPTPSSSSQEISESSSGESTALWDTPSQKRDNDEDMRQISKQSQRADDDMGKKKGKDNRRIKGAMSPVHLTSSSRSSSYSSVLSTASSNEGNGNALKQQNNGTFASTPKKKLTQSVSDAPLLRKRSPYPKMDPPSVSPTHSATNRRATFARSSPQSQPPFKQTPRTVSSPSMFTNLFGNESRQAQGRMSQDISLPQWPYQDTTTSTSYSAFGKSQFNFMENLMGNVASSGQNNISQSWESPYSDNSSLYSSPSPSRPSENNGASPPMNLPVCSQQWGTAQQTTYYDASPGTPTTPGRPPPGLWSDVQSPMSTTSMTTHSIWSVSNAVTMDENRNTEERDPLGVRSIWSNNHHNPDYRNNIR